MPLEEHKQLIQNFVQFVWNAQDLRQLDAYWTEDCINHAMPDVNNRGLDALRGYYEQLFMAFSAFSNTHTGIVQQVAEGDRVVTHMVSRGEHTAPFLGIAPTHRNILLFSIRIDRIEDGKIAEHWSVADMAGLMQQLQG